MSRASVLIMISELLKELAREPEPDWTVVKNLYDRLGPVIQDASIRLAPQTIQMTPPNPPRAKRRLDEEFE